MASILIEFVLKYINFIKEEGGYRNADPQNWDQFENMELSSAINRAKRAGLIDSKMARRLHSFRDKIRNPYNHYNIKKITDRVVAHKLKQLDVKTGEVLEIDLPAKDSPMIQAQAKPIVDEQQVMAICFFADEVVKSLFAQINCFHIKNCSTGSPQNRVSSEP